MALIKQIETFKTKKATALLMDGAEKIKRRHEQGKPTARERIDRLFDPEIGLNVVYGG